jgi:hypothetical protein
METLCAALGTISFRAIKKGPIFWTLFYYLLIFIIAYLDVLNWSFEPLLH